MEIIRYRHCKLICFVALCFLQFFQINCRSIELVESIKPLNEQNKSMKIIAGDNVKLGEFPSQVSLQKFGTHFCGGSLFNPQFVLTAAHCVEGIKDEQLKNGDIIVLAGDIFLTDSGTKSREAKEISRIYMHPGYDFDKTGFYSDIAIIKLKKSFDLSDNLKPINLTTDNVPPAGDVCQIVGWGSTTPVDGKEDDDSVSSSILLQKADVTVMSNQECKKKYTIEFYDPQMLCVGGTKKDACQGDSGGPLICHNILYGVISSGSGCGSNESPGVYTNIAFYRHWIECIIASQT